LAKQCEDYTNKCGSVLKKGLLFNFFHIFDSNIFPLLLPSGDSYTMEGKSWVIFLLLASLKLIRFAGGSFFTTLAEVVHISDH